MIIDTIPVSAFQQNCRIIIDENSSKAAVIDPGSDAQTIIEHIKNRDAKVESIFLTHAHLDHVGGVSDLEALLKNSGTEIKLYASNIEKEMRQMVSAQAGMYGLPAEEFKDVREPDVYLEDINEFSIGAIKAKLLFTPGHSPGHFALYFKKSEETSDKPILIAGDTLFQGSIGRTDLPGGNHETLINSIRGKLYVLPDETVVKPGHGPDTTIGREKISNPFVQG